MPIDEVDSFLNWMEKKDIRKAKYELGLISCPYKWKYELAHWYQWEFGGSERAALRKSRNQLLAIWHRVAKEKNDEVR